MATKSLYNKADKKVQKWAKTISAIVIIVGALAGVCSWVSHQFATAVSNQISDFQQEMENSNLRQECAITRVELMALMEHDPDNVAAIEKIAKYYFGTLEGDSYMLQKYSEWAKQYGGDITIIVGVQ